MSKDKACISAVEEVCQRCHLYKENCGMLACPDQCSKSGHYIDGYRQAEKDLELSWEDLKTLDDISDNVYAECDVEMFDEKEYYQEILKRFLKERKQQ